MGRAFHPMEEQHAVEAWEAPNNEYVDPRSGLHYRMIKRDGKYIQQQFLLDGNGTELALDEAKTWRFQPGALGVRFAEITPPKGLPVTPFGEWTAEGRSWWIAEPAAGAEGYITAGASWGSWKGGEQRRSAVPGREAPGVAGRASRSRWRSLRTARHSTPPGGSSGPSPS